MTVDLTTYRAVLFDLDGVITPTAEVHMRAWAQMFNDFLGTREGQAPYTDTDYFEHVDGKPRYDGVRDFLTSRGITLPDGTPDDPSDQATGEETVRGSATARTTRSARCCGARASRPTPARGACSTSCASRACRWRSCRRPRTRPTSSRPPG
ncbi:MAG: family hydrolase [Nocardioides sp.]|nr:family hydrolase [Nocardioides sp.]